MKSIALNFLAGLAIIVMGLFPDMKYVVAICLTTVGLTFLQGTGMNRREFLAMITIGVSGVLMLLDYSWWSILPGIAGLLLMTSYFKKDRGPVCIMKWLIGICWCWMIGGASWVSFIAGGLMIVLSFSYIGFNPQTGDVELGT